MITAEVIRPPSSVDHLAADWDRLYRGSGREPSVSYEWARGILRHHLAGRQDWLVVVLRRGGQVAGIVPMMFGRDTLFGRPVTTLQLIQEKCNTHSDLLLADDGPELVGGWLDALAGLRDWDTLKVSRLLEHGTLATALSGELARRRAWCRWALERPSFHLPLPPSYTAYLGERSGKLRNYLKRAEKKLAAEGPVHFSRVPATADFAAAYEDLLAIERDSWKQEHGTAISAIAHQEGFYRDLAEATLASGTLHLTFLRLGGAPIAYNLGLVVGQWYSYVKTSYCAQYRPHGAASIGRARLIEQLIAEGCTAIDFPGEPYEWEQQWTDDVRWFQSLLLFNSTLAGRTLGLLARARDTFKPPKEDRTIVFTDARAARPPAAT